MRPIKRLSVHPVLDIRCALFRGAALAPTRPRKFIPVTQNKYMGSHPLPHRVLIDVTVINSRARLSMFDADEFLRKFPLEVRANFSSFGKYVSYRNDCSSGVVQL
ncbi:hypothetical protein PUN28_005259 [Cardiocondyla obscurior]|uniref:Uncharacterized protein n=1 Tax=Cardiocondyla obscurior TaxID=286306 RepID=A0AAW2GHS6_9HYME